MIIIFLFSALLLIRLAYLQLAQYKRFQTLSQKNQLSITPIAPARGLIKDRNGVILADNIPIYALEIIPDRVKNIHATLAQLQSLIPSITQEDIENFHKARQGRRSFMPVPFKIKLSQEEVALFAVNQYQFPGVAIKAQLMRYYPYAEQTAHVLGYVGRINTQDLTQVDNGNYRATHFIGKTGIEKFYEPLLHGQVGYQQVETDVSGRTIRVLKEQYPVAGDELNLTLDIHIQNTAYHALQDKRGAIILLDVHNGAVLAMVSSPSFNSNAFVNGISHQHYNTLAQHPSRPLFNRAVRGLYPPASTIKPFIALAALNKAVIRPETKIYDRGWFKLPQSSHLYRDWKKTGHGMVDLARAITVSCDTYFYQLSQKLGISVIEELLTEFGFGQLSHIDLPDEASGIVPNEQWKRARHKQGWYPGDTVITAIGQGFLLSSPLQLANATAALANKGQRYRPHLIQKARQYSSGLIHEVMPLEEYPVKIQNVQDWDIINQAMQMVIKQPGGTGYRFGKNTAYSVAAKTGTAQVHSAPQYEKLKYQDIPEQLRDHSLFIAFAPAEKPQVAIAVIVENDFIAPNIARKVLDSYFKSKEKEAEPSV
ncbi:MAG: penicillin-binding protein 2 [Legionellaceae bacterium]|nr:penicillin-binding protein 2 [Legionellaceae bacterium]